MADLDHDAAMFEIGMVNACRAYLDRAGESAMARRFIIGEAQTAIQHLQSAVDLIARAQRRVA